MKKVVLFLILVLQIASHTALSADTTEDESDENSQKEEAKQENLKLSDLPGPRPDGTFPKGHPLYDPLLDEDLTMLFKPGAEGDSESTEVYEALMKQLLSKMLPPWISHFHISPIFGYTDNVTYSPFESDDAFYMGMRFEYLLTSSHDKTTDGWTFFAYGERLQYGGTEQVEDDSQVILRAVWEPLPVGKHQWKHTATYLFWDTVTDSSLADTEIEATGVQFNDFSLSTEWAYEYTDNFSFGARAEGRFLSFKELEEDYYEYEGGGFLRWETRRREVDLFFRGTVIDYTDSLNRDLTGLPIVGSSKDQVGYGVELTWREKWSKAFRTDTLLELEYLQDDGVGYDDYIRFRAVQSFRYTAGDWRFRLFGRISYRDFDERLANPSVDMELYNSAIWRAGLEVEYDFSKDFTFFTQIETENRFSNRDSTDYDSYTFELGFTYKLPL